MISDRCLSCTVLSILSECIVAKRFGCIKMPLGIEVGLGPGHIVLDGDPAPSRKRPHTPVFGTCLLWPNGRIDQDATSYEGRPGLSPSDIVVRWGPSCRRKGAQQPPLFGPCLFRSSGWMDQDATWYEGRPWPRPHCVRWGPSSPHVDGPSSPPTLFGHVCCGQTVAHLSYC